MVDRNVAGDIPGLGDDSQVDVADHLGLDDAGGDVLSVGPLSCTFPGIGKPVLVQLLPQFLQRLPAKVP